MREGGITNSSLDFCIQYHDTDTDKCYNLTINNGVVGDTLMLHGTKCPESDGSHASDNSQDKHEESIIWKGAFVSEKLQDCCPSEALELDDGYVSGYEQEELIMQKNDRIAWWASTWPSATGLEEDDALDSLSSLQTDSDGHVDLDSPSWRDTQLVKSFEQKISVQRPATSSEFSSTGSTQCFSLDKLKDSTCENDMNLKKFREESKTFMEFDLFLSQDNTETFAKGINVPKQRGTAITSILTTDSVRDFNEDNDCNFLSCSSPNIARDVAMCEDALEPSHNIIDTEDLDRLFSETKFHKDFMKKRMEEVYFLRQKVEEEELVANKAKSEVTRGVEDFLSKVEDLRRQTLCKRAQYDMQAAEVYGERSVLSMEARELRLRLTATQAEQSRAMSILTSVHCTLAERLKKASKKKDLAVEEANLRVKNAKKLLAHEEDSAHRLAEDQKALERDAETCRKLREFLIQRGNLIDSLQGEMLVLCEDIINFKKQVDKDIPLSASHCSSWSHMSHMAHQSMSVTPSMNVHSIRTSNCTESLSSSSMHSLSSPLSGMPSSVGPIDCTVQSQYFSSNTGPSGTLDVAKEDILNAELEGLATTAFNSCDDSHCEKHSPGDSFAANTVIPATALELPKQAMPSFQ